MRATESSNSPPPSNSPILGNRLSNSAYLNGIVQFSGTIQFSDSVKFYVPHRQCSILRHRPIQRVTTESSDSLTPSNSATPSTSAAPSNSACRNGIVQFSVTDQSLTSTSPHRPILRHRLILRVTTESSNSAAPSNSACCVDGIIQFFNSAAPVSFHTREGGFENFN